MQAATSTCNAHGVTELLRAWSGGDSQAWDQLAPLVYTRLLGVARQYTYGERAGRAFDANDLVHEAFLRLGALRRINWQNSGHFCAVAARFMRRILVDFGRSHCRAKREGHSEQVPLEEVLDRPAAFSTDASACHAELRDTLAALAQFDPRKGRVVELRFFGGLTADEIAAALNISSETVLRDWKLAKAWMYREMTAGHSSTARERLAD
jgi:RNA polymerase sigma factor (TIGR02999 family)